MRGLTLFVRLLADRDSRFKIRVSRNPNQLRAAERYQGAVVLCVRFRAKVGSANAETTFTETRAKLLLYHTAGDAVAGIAGWVGLHVIGFGVDYDCGAAIAEERVSVGAEVYILIREPDFGFPIGAYGEVGHVASVVAIGIVKTVFFAVWIKVRAGGFEIGRVAFRILMEMDRVFARRKIFEIKLQAHAAFLVFIQDHSADAFPLGVL